MKTVFIDSNIIIDLIAQREPHYESIAKIASLAENKKIKMFASSLSFVNIFYILSKYIDKKKLYTILKKIRIICDVATVNTTVIDKRLASDFSDFEDAVQYQNTLISKCNILITRNKKDFKKSEIPVMTATEFLISITKK